MQGLWPQLYPYNDYPGIRLNATKDDYSLEVNTSIEEGEESWSPVEGIASGGERSVACLSMRVALAMVVVPNLRWLILDEPTHNIDASGISKLIETLSGPLPELVDQIFIITHEEELKQIPGTVYVLGRNKAANAPTEVSGA
jgi:DNA repair exonuclease SbcCD ATPase subunit